MVSSKAIPIRVGRASIAPPAVLPATRPSGQRWEGLGRAGQRAKGLPWPCWLIWSSLTWCLLVPPSYLASTNQLCVSTGDSRRPTGNKGVRLGLIVQPLLPSPPRLLAQWGRRELGSSSVCPSTTRLPKRRALNLLAPLDFSIQGRCLWNRWSHPTCASAG